MKVVVSEQIKHGNWHEKLQRINTVFSLVKRFIFGKIIERKAHTLVGFTAVCIRARENLLTFKISSNRVFPRKAFQNYLKLSQVMPLQFFWEFCTCIYCIFIKPAPIALSSTTSLLPSTSPNVPILVLRLISV